MATASIGIKKKDKKEKKKAGVDASLKRFATKTTSGVGARGGSPSKYVVKSGYKIPGDRKLYTGSTYEYRGGTWPIDDIGSAGHIAHRRVATYLKGEDLNYGGYKWQGQVMEITGSAPAYTITAKGTV